MLPVTIVDDFLDQPDEWREYALGCEYFKSVGRWPGFRTKPLAEINKVMHNRFMIRLLSLFLEPKDNDLMFEAKGTFQKIPPGTGEGWVHRDNQVATAIVYLNPDADLNAGTSLFRPKKNNIWSMMYDNVRKENYRGNISAEEAEPYRLEYNSQFEETVRINNVYNRLVVFEGGIHHAANVLQSNGDDRLTLVFFIDALYSRSTLFPLTRLKCF